MLGNDEHIKLIYLQVGRTARHNACIMQYMRIGPTKEEFEAAPTHYDSRVNGSGVTVWHRIYSYCGGIIKKVTKEANQFEGEDLIVYTDLYRIQIGTFDGPRSIGLLRCLSNPDYKADMIVYLYPYSFVKNEQRYSGVDVKLDKGRDAERIKWAPIHEGYNPPQPSKVSLKGKEVLDYYPLASYLLQYVQNKLNAAAPAAATAPTTPDAPEAAQGSDRVATDDLPF